MSKKIISMLLALAMICQFFPVTTMVSAAEPEQVQTPIQIDTQTCINPLYADVITEDELPEPREPAPDEPSVVADIEYAQTLEEAGAFLRSAMEQRQEQVSVGYQAEAYDAAYFGEIVDAAVIHTGIPTQGDSLKWVWGGYRSSGSYYNQGGVCYITLTYNFRYYTTAEQETEMDAKVDALLEELSLYDAGDYEKIKGIYDYICGHITYDYDNLEDNSYNLKYTAYAALVNGTAVCQGYAALLYRLALELGIDARMIAGSSAGDGVQDHGWNIVQVDGLYYNADSTWDAGYNSYNWFLQSEANFTRNYTRHIRSESYDTQAFHAAYPMGEMDYAPDVIPDETEPEETEPEQTLPEETIPEETEPEIAQIASGTCGENLTWVLTEDGTLTISGEGEMVNYNRAGTPWYSYCEQITTVLIEEGVTSIGNWAFYNCAELSDIVIPESVTTIGDSAIRDCQGLTEITLPQSLTTIGDYAFGGCQGITEIAIPSTVTTIGSGAFDDTSNLTAVYIEDLNAWCQIDFSGSVFSNPLYYAGNLYVNGELVEGLILPDGMTEVKNYTFIGCTMSRVVIPEGVTTIGQDAFCGCQNLSSVELPDTVEIIEDEAFGGCTSLKEVDLPCNLQAIYPYAFVMCIALEHLELPESLLAIAPYAFGGCASLTSVDIPAATTVNVAAFVQSGLETITVAEGNANEYAIDSVLFGTFDGVTGLVLYPTCRAGEEYVIPDGMQIVGGYAFAYNTNLKKVTVPASMEAIDSYAFAACTNLEEVIFLGDVPSFGDDVFMYVNHVTIHYPEGNESWLEYIASLEASSDGNISFEGIDVSGSGSGGSGEGTGGEGSGEGSGSESTPSGTCGENLTWVLTEDGTLTISGEGEMKNYHSISMPWYSYREQITTVLIEKGVTSIGNCAFYNCAELSDIVIPEGVTAIGSYAFEGCKNLTNVTIPEGVTAIGSYAFEGCKNLTNVTIPEGVTTIGSYAFKGCENLTNVTIPEGVTTIGSYAFEGCENLTNVTIPESVASLGYGVFCNCTNLSKVTFLGDAPSIGGANTFEAVTATVYYPAENDTWTEDVIQDYGGNLTWVSVEPPLKITSQPEDYVGALNSYATFTVEAAGENLTYQWYFSSDNGVTWKRSSSEGYNTNTLRVQIKEYRLGQSYRCEITDSAGNVVTSNGATMGIPESTIEIVTQPTDFTGAATETVEFTVEATGKGLTYRWYYSNNGGESWAASYSDGYDTETVKPVLRAYNTGRLFKCLITDVNGNTAWTDAVCMTIASSEITILSQPVSYTGALNDLATFTVEAEGTNLSYLWYFSTDGGETWQQSYNEGYTTNALNVRLYAYRSGYQYKCIIISGVDIAVETDVVTISKKPSTATILSQPLNAGGEVGTNVTFHVDATGTDLTYQWQFSNNGGESWGSTTAQGSTTDTLTVEVKAYRDGYLYRCVVTDDSGSTVASQPATLRVGIMPVIIRQPESYTGAADTTATFTVEATGENLTYQWQYSNNGGETWSDSGATGADTPSLEVPALAYRNGQMYRCVITNEFGSVISQEATLTVK